MVESAEEILNKYWGYESFRGSQKAVIDAVLRDEDVIALMPTGGGKSVCYQIPALIREGICLVVSPLVALMEDQLAGLKARGVKAMGLYGKLTEEDLLRRLDNAVYGGYRLLYLSPERLAQDLVLQHIARMPVNLMAIDEAHCISQWGFDFRPAYLQCAQLREMHPGVPLMALTATATPEVLDDITRLLGLQKARVFKDSIGRPNLVYSVCRAEDKRHRLLSYLEGEAGSAIVYVRTRRESLGLSEYLLRRNISATHFHGGLTQQEKKARLQAWQNGKARVMVATNAFGMGIDKADVRLVFHFDIPETIEHYFQEAGRAGRDGEPATAILLYGPADLQRSAEYFLGNLPGIDELISVYRKLCNYFQIAYGELPEKSFSFRLEAFCHAYGFGVAKAFNALELLDRHGVLSLLPIARTDSRLQFLCNKAGLWSYLESHPQLRETVQVLLRTYGGLFDFETPIRLDRMSRKLNIAEAAFTEQLQKMQRDGLIALELKQGDLEVLFLQPREDDQTVHAFSREVKVRQELKRRKVGQMADFIRNDQVCRERQLLTYFGEPATRNCGRCDVCTAGEPTERELSIVRGQILRELSSGPKTSRELAARGCGPEPALLRCLQHLLEDEKLRLGPNNEYIPT